MSRDHCVRCGECCLSTSPTLQKADVPLVLDGYIERTKLYTVRPGELVNDNVLGRLKITDKELIKVREGETRRGCVFYDDGLKACAIYEHRPLQCSALACWDAREFMRVYATPKAERKDLIFDRVLLDLIKEHDQRCAYTKLDRFVRQIEQDGDKAVVRILGLLKFDHDLRSLMAERLTVHPGELDFILGRPLTKTITMFGLQVTREPDGSFFLTALNPSHQS